MVQQNNISKVKRKVPQSSSSSSSTQKSRTASNQSQRSRIPTNPLNSPQYTVLSNSSEPTTVAVSAKRIDNHQKHRHQRKTSSPGILSSLVFYLIRMIIFGVGIGAIAGTALTTFDPTNPLIINSNSSEPSKTPETPKQQPQPQQQDLTPQVSLTQKLTSLEKKLAVLATKYPKLKPGAFFVDLDKGAYVDFQGETVFSAASTIKIPVLVAFFQDVDAGKVHLDEMLTMSKDVIGSGSGDMQHQTPGKKFTALEVATKMIVISDNTATNMIIARLGGKEVLNQRFHSWGLTTTVINNALPDLEGKNTTSPKDLANLLIRVNQGELVSLKSRDRLLGIMEQTHTRTLLPQGLEKEAIIAHKTGDIGTILGDAGIIDMPNGKRYVGAVMVKRPHNDYTARTLIQEISRTTYQHLKWYEKKAEVKKNEQ